MDDIKEDIKEDNLNLRQAKKSGGSVRITLTGFVTEKEYYDVSKNNRDGIITLTPVRIENYKN